MAAKLAFEFNASSDTIVHVPIRYSIIVGEELLDIGGLSAYKKKFAPKYL